MTDNSPFEFDLTAFASEVSDFLLGDSPTLRRAEVADRAGIDLEVARTWWRALGFPQVGDDAVAFSESDVEALKMTARLIEAGIIRSGSETAFIRTTGRTFARLAEWQVRAMVASMTETDAEQGFSLDTFEETVAMAEQVQMYVWRRHLISAVNRLVLNESEMSELDLPAASSASDPQAVDKSGGAGEELMDARATNMCAGFADIVGYTGQSRRMSIGDLAAMVERFEDVVAGLITDHHGRVIKTIGDEILFVVDSPSEAALLALELLEQHDLDKTFPQVRIGMAYGAVLSRLGDVFGPVVNLASRLTSVAKPGRVIIDRSLADQLADEEGLRLRRKRRVAVKGYSHLEPWSLKRALGDDESKGPLTGVLDSVLDDATRPVGGAARRAHSAVTRARRDENAIPTAIDEEE